MYTLNAFPYGGFHDDVVKHSVYRPQWTDPRRLEYTVDCAIVLADLLPDTASYGSISTLPLAWRTPWDDADDAAAAGALGRADRGARRHGAARSGRPIRLAVEPEPGCVLDSVADAVAWLAPRVDPRYVGLCLDTCHLAVSFADPAETVAAIYDAGLSVVKVQASAALQVDEPGGEPARLALADFTEPRYLHQVRERTGDGEVLGADDIPQALTELPAQRAVAGALPRAAARPAGRAAVGHHRRAARRDRRAGVHGGRASCRTSRWRPTPGACCRRPPAAAGTPR